MAEIPTIGEEFSWSSSKQEYAPKKTIGGVRIIEGKVSVGEDGFLVEEARFTAEGKMEAFPELGQVRQVNDAVNEPGTRKAWHYHLEQDEVFYIPPDSKLIVGLMDLRVNSPTNSMTMRLVLGGGKAQFIFVPRGVAHGFSNPYERPMRVSYFINNQFNGTDEWRLPYDFKVGKEFWEMQKG